MGCGGGRTGARVRVVVGVVGLLAEREACHRPREVVCWLLRVLLRVLLLLGGKDLAGLGHGGAVDGGGEGGECAESERKVAH